MTKVFLAGPVNDSKWRDLVIEKLRIDYFNPATDVFDKKIFDHQIAEKERSDFLLYVLTPTMKSVFSIAELVDDSCKCPEKVLYCYITTEEGLFFNKHQMKSLDAIGEMVNKNGGKWCKTLDEAISFLNCFEEK